MSPPGETHLPDVDSLHFERPPIVELALGIQFEPIAGLTGLKVGLYWRKRRKSFPRTEEHPPLPPAFEVFPAPRTPGVKIELQMLDRPPVPRHWLLNEPGTELLQIQPDRFVHNWRKQDDGDTYPSYERVRGTFIHEVGEFQGFLREESLGELSINQCELIYVDHVLSGDHWRHHRELEAVYRWWSGDPAPEVGELEEVRVQQKHIIREPAGEPWGRLHMNIAPAWRTTDDLPIFVLTQVARGMGRGSSMEDALTFLDLAHDAAVKTFAGSMTGQMLQTWGMTTHA